MSNKKDPKINDTIKLREMELEMKRIIAPPGFSLDTGPIAIDVVDRTYGIQCECGCTNFSEDEEFSKLFCSECKKPIAIRVVEIGWVN